MRAAAGLVPGGASIEVFDIAGIPPFNQDEEGQLPQTVAALKAKIRDADAILFVTAEYNYSIAEQHNVAPHRYLELSLPGTIILPHDCSILAKYKVKIDFENGDRWSHTINAGVAKRLSNIPVVLSAIVEKPLNGGAKKFQVNFTMIYYFESYRMPK